MGRWSGGRLAGWAILLAALWFVLGAGGLVVGLCIVAADLLWAPQPRLLLAVAAALVAALPLVVLAGGLPDPLGIGPQFTAGHGGTDLLAGAALALLTVATIRDARCAATGAGRSGPPN
jgi:hypothetical protein